MAVGRNTGLHISWKTLSYRSVVLCILSVAVILGAFSYLVFPTSAPVVAVMAWAGSISDRLGFGNLGNRPGAVGSQQAHFTALDGTVRVKKANSNAWVSADFSQPLEKGDVVQTDSEGMAKLFFSDGTSYSLKPDSLIVIEENSTNSQQQSQVAVQVTTGTVDLSTGSYPQGSTSQVIVAGATASLAPESAAMVLNDPRMDKHQILVKKGSGRVTRNDQTLTISNYQMVSFQNQSPMTTTQEVGPPTLVSPAESMLVFVTAVGKPIDFAWSPAEASHGYHLRISQNPYFSSTLYDRIVPGTEVEVSGLKEGAYYWVVTSLDINGHESVESERNQFSVVLRSNDVAAVPLELEPFVQHGHVLEITGKTDPSARVMVNGNEVPIVRSDGGFSYFTPPLPSGENTITVTAQTPKGGVKTHQDKVVIE